MRLFVALELPWSHKQSLLRLCGGLNGVRWVVAEQLHLTLRFIGECDRAAADVLADALAEVIFQPFELCLRGVGQFPPRGQARVLWAGVAPSPALVQLQAAVEAAVRSAGQPAEDKPFSPHITLARLKTPPHPEALRKFYEWHVDFETPPFTITEFVLMESTLRPDGAQYTVLERCTARN